MSRTVRRTLAALAVLVVVVWTTRDAWSSRRLPMAQPIIVTNAFSERYDTLHRNETLSHVMNRHNIAGSDLYRLLAAADDLDPRRLPLDLVFRFRYPLGDSRANRVRIRLDDRVVRLVREGDEWKNESYDVMWSVEQEHVTGAIQSSLYETLHDIIPDSVLPEEQRNALAWDLADGVFGWVIDFTRDIYPGDRLEVVYERLTSQLGDVRYGRVLAAKISTRGEDQMAYMMEGPDGQTEYYDADGNSLRGAFRMYPVKFKYISSGFSRARLHPILKIRRPHLGVDYRAPTGTPIRATGDGTVIRAGRWGSYGIMVAIRHPKGIETRYAHMSRLAEGIHAGVRVGQDQTIGYVGMTGLATAPHAHYEFIQNGRHINPRLVQKFGRGDPVPKALRAAFEQLRARYDRLLAAYASPSTKAAGVD